jgi:ABC-type transport system substrate-binding protein
VIMPLQRNQDREYRSTRPAFEVVGMPGDVYRLHSREIPLPETRFVGDNRARYANPELDALIDRYYLTIPRAERVALFGQILRLETDQLPQLPFLYEAGPLLVGNRIRNVTSVPVWNANVWEAT